jgi:uncharacterized protein YjiS (DUF1127 family)
MLCVSLVLIGAHNVTSPPGETPDGGRSVRTASLTCRRLPCIPAGSRKRPTANRRTSKLCCRSHLTCKMDGTANVAVIGMEAAMSTSTDAASFRAHCVSPWGELNHVLGEWWQHLRSRHELESLDDSMLRDIGLSRGEAGFEASASKPFWMN